ncbi:hypothetical protein UlMin_044329 [Ulmus minor]
MDSGGGGCCRCCFSFIFTLGLTALFMWLSLRASKPTCSIQEFYLPALNKTLNSQKNTSLILTLKLDNGNKDKGIYYDAINLTLSYEPNRTFPINATTIPEFYQGHKKKATRRVLIQPEGLNWTAVRAAISTNKTAIFRLDLATKVRFKIMGWKTKRHGLVVGQNVEVNDLGTKVKAKGIKLSGGTRVGASAMKNREPNIYCNFEP